MIKLDKPKDAAMLCSKTLELEPSNKKARLRRGLAYEALGMGAKAGADMVLLLADDGGVSQARECLMRCVKKSPSLRTDILHEITAVYACGRACVRCSQAGLVLLQVRR
jgi:hypothetical protein